MIKILNLDLIEQPKKLFCGEDEPMNNCVVLMATFICTIKVCNTVHYF
jgi:hypothetical protein